MLKARRAPDFAETGEYLVDTMAGTKRIYRDTDPHVRWLLVQPPARGFGDYLSDYLGSTKDEALRALEERFGVPATASSKYSDVGRRRR